MAGDIQYSFDYHVFGSESLSLEAHKQWEDGRTSVVLDVVDWGTPEAVGALDRYEAEIDRLTQLQENKGVEAAMNEAERIAVENGMLEADRNDPRLFTDGPPDPFMTLREQELDNREQRIEEFREEADQRATTLLEPAAPDVNYAFEVAPGQEPGTLELLAEKLWVEPDGELKTQFQAVREYETSEEGEAFHTMGKLYEVADKFGRDAAMNDAVAMAVEDGYIAEDKSYLFTDGPPDNFTAPQPELEIGGGSSQIFLLPDDAPVNYALSIVDADPHTTAFQIEKHWKESDGKEAYDLATIQTYDAADPDSFDEALADRDRLLGVYAEEGLGGLVEEIHDIRDDDSKPLFHSGPADDFTAQPAPHITEEMPQNDFHHTEDWGDAAPYWRLDAMPVNDPEGNALGQALFIVRYPDVEQGVVAPPGDAHFEMLEMAHFKDEKDAAAFGRDFHSHLVPGIIDGPELAEAVAFLEGHPKQWQTLEGEELESYKDVSLTLTRQPEKWHLYNPNAEREARLAAESPGMELDF